VLGLADVDVETGEVDVDALELVGGNGTVEGVGRRQV
jgi:hypothetical protein